MVTSTLYLPNPDMTVWRQQGAPSSQVGKGEHAEKQCWKQLRTTPKICMFNQDAAPCADCDDYFRNLSLKGEASFIFCISEPGYPVVIDFKKGDKIGGMYLPASQREAEKFTANIVKNKAIVLDKNNIPATMYYYKGAVFLDIRPVSFPLYPAQPPPLGTVYPGTHN